MKNFVLEVEGTTFQFISMNRRRVQLFQVHGVVDDKAIRFHMQINEASGDLKITEPSQCPEQYRGAEKLFSDAIKIHGKTEKIPT
ncbi:hypothetical protein BC343_25355 [Mucilaginibacter pedocola]|uniref:Uncharacterized protein n=1 Tax=Mucilaginibacter pedocola TaxID=1792845 RepID=A0A1S9PHC5_9SPHI|nr:hypothetical protein BC343_25355 [Mucilaginibacter pedocola]